METKRKRASFSSAMPSAVKTTPKVVSKPIEQIEQIEPIEQREPPSHQVLEVVEEVSPPAVQVEKVAPPKEEPWSPPVRQHVEIVEEEPEDDTLRVEEEPEVEESKPIKTTPIPEILKREVTIAPEPPIQKPIVDDSVNDKQPLPAPRITHGSLNSDDQRVADDARQKKTVAELFGNSENVMPEITVHKSSNKKGLLLWIITMIAIAIGIGGGLILFAGRSVKPQEPIPNAVMQPTPFPTSAPVPTAAPTAVPVVKANFKVSVVNGGGKVGAGSKMKALLESDGYTVTDVSNAPSYTYDQTEILTKASASAALSVLKDDLTAGSYTVGKMETTLPDKSAYDVQVIVGK